VGCFIFEIIFGRGLFSRITLGGAVVELVQGEGLGITGVVFGYLLFCAKLFRVSCVYR